MSNKEEYVFPYGEYLGENVVFNNSSIAIDLTDNFVNIMLRYNGPNVARESNGDLWMSVYLDTPNSYQNPFTIDDLITVLQYAKLKITERKNNQET